MSDIKKKEAQEMGAWDETLYGNDAVQDTMNLVLKAEQRGDSIDEILTMMKTTLWWYTEEVQLVTADLEYHFVGQTDYIEDILDLIDEMKEELDTWADPIKRLNVLEAFEEKLSTPPTQILPRSVLRDWLLDGRATDLIEEF